MKTTILILVIGIIGYFILDYWKRRKYASLLLPYDDAVKLSRHYIKVVANEKCGVIDKRGKVIVPLNFSDVKISELPGYFYVAMPDSHDKNNLLRGVYKEELIICCNYRAINYSKKLNGFLVTDAHDRDCHGLYSLSGKMILDAKWVEISKINDDCYLTSDYKGVIKKSFMVYASDGNILISKSREIAFLNDLFIVRRESKRYTRRAVYKADGEMIIPFEVCDPYKTSEQLLIFIGKNHFLLCDHSDRRGSIYDKNGVLKYSGCSNVEKYNGYYVFTINFDKKQWVVVDEDLVLHYEAEDIYYDKDNQLLILHDTSGELVIDRCQCLVYLVQRCIPCGKEKYVNIEHDGTYRIYYKGKSVFATFSPIVFYRGYYKVIDERGNYFLNSKGKRVLAPKFEN